MTKEMGAASRLNARPHLGVRKIGGSPLALRWAIGFVLVAACARAFARLSAGDSYALLYKRA